MAEFGTYCIRGEDAHEYGPVEIDELREWIRENRVGLGTSVRVDEEGSPWRRWQDFPELMSLLGESPTASSGAKESRRTAPLGRRFGAFLVDLFLCFIPICFPYLALFLTLPPDVIKQWTASPYLPPSSLPAYFEPVATLIICGGIMLYAALFHATLGRTPGKMLFGLRVVDEAGKKPGWGKSLLRGFIYAISFNFILPLTFLLFNPLRRALHDWAAGTYVILDESREKKR